MQTTTLASFRFPLHLIDTRKKSFSAQELIDFLKLDPSYFLKSFRKKFRPAPSLVAPGEVVTGDPGSADAFDIVSKKRDAHELLAATAALADFHQFILRENVDHWEAIAPDLALWRDFPGAYVLWTAKIVGIPSQDGAARPSPSSGAEPPARMRLVRQLVADAGARDAVSKALHLQPEVRIEDEDMIVTYLARKTRRPAHADGQ
ncbi:hypothetical protein [uncultured Rhodoblastus sp.]|uniref:hypothetical protein n=1 Tax=uncultured Rhodoblastus sp. TaxID=543037 RepID=UPI0025E32A22|nr:hypothetical protein [uncultured Rhodoblastus sp.]